MIPTGQGLALLCRTRSVDPSLVSAEPPQVPRGSRLERVDHTTKERERKEGATPVEPAAHTHTQAPFFITFLVITRAKHTARIPARHTPTTTKCSASDADVVVVDLIWLYVGIFPIQNHAPTIVHLHRGPPLDGHRPAAYPTIVRCDIRMDT